MMGPEAMETVIATVSDVAMVVDANGTVEDVSFSVPEFDELGPAGMKGRPLEDAVTEESRPKIREMIAAALAGEEPRWREINHVVGQGAEFPVRYQAVPAGDRILFLGRELRVQAALQTRLMRAQQALDQDYGRLRQMETRYRVLFQTITEPLLIVAADTGRIQEANAAAGRLLGCDSGTLAGTPLASVFEKGEREKIADAIERLKRHGGPATLVARAEEADVPVELNATLFRAADAMMVLCRLKPARGGGEREMAIEEMLFTMVGRISDAVVMTDPEGRILWCNDAFLALAEIALPEQAQGEPLERFLGRPGVDVDVILANARRHSHLRAFDAVVRGTFGSTTRVEVSAASLASAQPPAVGFIMRDMSRSEPVLDRSEAASAQSVEQLMELVGSVPLKELVRASTDQIEKICIEAALEMTGGNRASAAEMLGLSRQSLYVKLRRFGLIDQGEEG